MKIVECELVGYNRMSISGNKYFKVKFTEVIQLILGTNGSGKSSLLKELFPFAAERADYAPEGSKRLVVEHNGFRYISQSSFSPTKYELIKQFPDSTADQVLYTGSSIKLFNEIITNEFGVTPDIRELLLNNVNFSTMSPSQRRQYFTMMSDADYTYGLTMFKQITDRLRDVVGALRLANTRLVTETAKLIKPEDRDRIQKELEALHNELEFFYKERDRIERPGDAVETELHQVSNMIIRVSTNILNVSENHFDPKYQTVDEINDEIQSLRAQLQVVAAMIDQQLEQHDRISKDLVLLNESGGGDLQAVINDLNELEDKDAKLRSQLSLGITFEDTYHAYTSFRAVRDELDEIFNQLEPNDSHWYSSANLKEKKEQREQLLIKQQQLQSQLRALETKLEHQDYHSRSGAVRCPKCSTEFVAGYDPQLHEQLKTQVGQIQLDLDVLSKEESELITDIDKLVTFFDFYRSFLRIKSSQPALNAFWTIIDKDNMSFVYPKAVLGYLGKLDTDFKLLLEIADLAKPRQRLEVIRSALEQADLNSITQSKTQLAKLDEQMNTYVQKRTAITHSIDRLQLLKDNLIEFNRQHSELKDLLVKTNDLKKERVKTIRDQILGDCVRQLQSSLAIKEDQFSNMNIQAGIVEDLEEQVQSLQVEEQALRLLAKELSPTEGLIAEGLTGFINAYISQTNEVTRHVWTYPLEILPCTIDDSGVDLDYRFPMIVGESRSERKDIKFGSRGMQEIVDLSYKIVAMKYLGLQDFPLFLDEFGSGFDELHRERATETIKRLIAELNLQQVFMVSHYETSYGALANKEVTVLCNTNIKLNTEYNAHVIIK